MNRDPRPNPPELLRALPLPAVLRLWGATPDPRDRHKWHTAQGVLSVNGAKFMNWNRGEGGGGAIDLVMHLKRCGFRDALGWLAAHFPPPPAPLEPGTLAPPLSLPPPQPTQLAGVRHYLLQARHLAAQLIDGLIQTGSLYADQRANAVFLLLGAHGTPVGAELRGTTARAWRGMAPGADNTPASCAWAWLIAGAVFASVPSASGQQQTELGIDTYAGLAIRGELGKVYSVAYVSHFWSATTSRSLP
jgi:hypothetical protein